MQIIYRNNKIFVNLPVRLMKDQENEKVIFYFEIIHHAMSVQNIRCPTQSNPTGHPMFMSPWQPYINMKNFAINV